jgi:hypothetical protein
MKTGQKTSKQEIWGEKLYLARARAALPLLVRQAWAGQPIFYSALAEELGMPNPRNLNYVLSAIGKELEKLGRVKGTDIPPIQALVINKSTQLPSEGIRWFLRDDTALKEYTRANNMRRREILRSHLLKVFNFPYWSEVLNKLNLPEPPESPIAQIPAMKTSGRSEEGPDHKALKEMILKEPKMLDILNHNKSEMEWLLRSGDRLDVYIETPEALYAIEVKSHTSPPPDIVRGIFQTIKYAAVLEAEQRLVPKSKQKEVYSILALGAKLPDDLVSLRNTLNVTVKDNLRPNGS